MVFATSLQGKDTHASHLICLSAFRSAKPVTVSSHDLKGKATKSYMLGSF